ncbi:hypothetical protein WG66_007798, partial [Moniliophthora roreri]
MTEQLFLFSVWTCPNNVYQPHRASRGHNGLAGSPFSKLVEPLRLPSF